MCDEAADVLGVLTVANRLAQATDDCDAAAYAACLAPKVCDGAKRFDGVAYARASIARASAMSWTHRQLMNPVVVVDIDQASARIDVVIAMALQIDGGRYDLRFERIDGTWRIARRSLHRRYVLGDAELTDP